MKRFSYLFVLLLLVACGGGGAGIDASPPSIIAPSPVTEAWTRTGIAIAPSQSWEFTPGAKRGFVGEPSILHRADRSYVMWYSGGWERCATGYATSSDGENWTKGVGPIIGQGKLGFDIACRNSVIEQDGQVYVYFSNSIGDVPGSIYVTHSANGVTDLSEPKLFLAPGSSDMNLANSWSAKLPDGRIKFFYDSITPSGTWEAFSATCDTPLGPCTKDAGPLKGLQFGKGAYGGGWARYVDGRYDTYYLAGPNGVEAGHLPTYIYHACNASTEAVKFGARGNPLITIPAGMDQVGDPFIVEDLSGTRMFWTDADNRTGYGVISSARLNGELSDFSCP